MRGSDVVERAREACGKDTVYALGKGGFDPQSPHPGGTLPPYRCDCSGFVAWCLGTKRHLKGVPWYDAQHNGEWFETSAITRDAKSPFGFVTEVGMNRVRPGDLLVYPDRIHPVTGKRQQGHIGIVSEVTREDLPLRVIHCSKGNWHVYGDAIRETVVDVFTSRSDCIAARVNWIEP